MNKLPKNFEKRLQEVLDMWQKEMDRRLEADIKIIDLVNELVDIIEK